MTSLPDLLQQGATHAWLFAPSAILLGALHGLEPGHSKTMMAAFIVAVRGTVTQAILLGLAATLSHTAVVWVIALGGQYLGQEWGGAASEPYLQLASAVLIVGIALWMAWRTWREQHHHHHHHHGGATPVATVNGPLTLEVFEDGVPPRWRVHAGPGSLPAADDLRIETVRPDGTLLRVGLGAHGDVFSRRHRHGARHEARASRDEDLAGWRGGGRHAHDQARGGDEAVVGAEHGGAQPADAVDEVSLAMDGAHGRQALQGNMRRRTASCQR